jgi:hypothetical protein
VRATPGERAEARLRAYAAADASTRRVVLAELCRPMRDDPGASDHWVRAGAAWALVENDLRRSGTALSTVHSSFSISLSRLHDDAARRRWRSAW